MQANINRTAIFAVFDLADNSSVSFAAELLKHGVGDRATAKPLAMEWAAKKYKDKITQGQRGDKLTTNGAAERAMYRVLEACFPRVDAPKAQGRRKVNVTDPVAKLFATWSKLSAAEKKRFATLQLKG